MQDCLAKRFNTISKLKFAYIVDFSFFCICKFKLIINNVTNGNGRKQNKEEKR